MKLKKSELSTLIQESLKEMSNDHESDHKLNTLAGIRGQLSNALSMFDRLQFWKDLELAEMRGPIFHVIQLIDAHQRKNEVNEDDDMLFDDMILDPDEETVEKLEDLTAAAKDFEEKYDDLKQ